MYSECIKIYILQIDIVVSYGRWVKQRTHSKQQKKTDRAKQQQQHQNKIISHSTEHKNSAKEHTLFKNILKNTRE